MDNPALIFKTGFEGDTRIIPFGESDNEMVGLELTGLALERFDLQYTGGDVSKRFAKIIAEPGNESNKVLWFWLNEAYLASENQVKARVQANIYGLKAGFRDFFQSVRVFLHPDFEVLCRYPHRIEWLTLAEFWNNTYWAHQNGFRITVGVGKPDADESDLSFIIDAQDSHTKTVWCADNPAVKVPIGQWFTLEYYYQTGDAQTGRFHLALTSDGQSRQIVCDVTGWTHCPYNPNPDGITDWNPLKLYTSKEVVGFVKSNGKTLQIYWDDLEIWLNRRPPSSPKTPLGSTTHLAGEKP